MKLFWIRLDALLKQGQSVFAAFVVRNTLHSPGTAGARLLVTEAGDVEGTIGGGIMEYNLVNRAREALQKKDFKPELHHLSHRDEGPGEKSGMICAGEQWNIYYLFRPHEHADTVAQIARFVVGGEAACATISPSDVSVNGPVAAKGPQYELTEDDDGWTYREQVLNLKRVAIMGGGHCGLALSRTLDQLGYDVFVFETRRELDTIRANTFACAVELVDSYRDAGPRVPYPALTDVVVMTTDFPSDIEALAGTVDLPFRSIGLMGSPAKIAHIRTSLLDAGIAKSFVDGLRAPVGISIGSNTPAEIAVSIAAEIVRDRNQVDSPSRAT